MNIIHIGLAAIVIAIVIVIAGRIYLANARRRVTDQPPVAQPQISRIDFVVLEAESPAISGSSSLNESVGIETLGGVFCPLLESGEKLPATTSETLTTSEDNQETVSLRIYRGSDKQTKNNTFIGEARIKGYQRAARGVPQILVTIKATDGKLSVGAADKNTGATLKPEIVEDPGTMAR